jgi:hypothetical protein
MNNSQLTVVVDKTRENLWDDLRKLVEAHSKNITKKELLTWLIKGIFTLLDVDPNIKSEYNPIYCQLWRQYAQNNIDPSGFWAEYGIEEGMCDIWVDQYEDFKKMKNMIPLYTTNLINKQLSDTMEKAKKYGDLKLMAQLTTKAMDLQFRGAKEQGVFKEQGQDNRKDKVKQKIAPSMRTWADNLNNDED